MRVLILGGSGMLGHKLYQVFQSRFDTWATVRTSVINYSPYGIFDPAKIIEGVDVLNFDTIIRAYNQVCPDVIVNAIGILKQSPAINNTITSLLVNSLLPHHLVVLCRTRGTRLVHLSTDGVFSGNKGAYKEKDMPDTDDFYGQTKLIGEVMGDDVLTLRTATIGRELTTRYGLAEWFLSQEGKRVQGYTGAIFNGFTTLALANIIADVIEHFPHLCGLYHVSSHRISKYNLLCLLREAYNVQIEIEPYHDFHCDRSLDSGLFREATGFVPSSWAQMVSEMAKDNEP